MNPLYIFRTNANRAQRGAAPRFEWITLETGEITEFDAAVDFCLTEIDTRNATILAINESDGTCVDVTDAIAKALADGWWYSDDYHEGREPHPLALLDADTDAEWERMQCRAYAAGRDE